MAKRVPKTGEFCWFNLMTPEPAKAKEFYSKVLRWTYDEIPGVGFLAKVNGTQVGGLFDVVSPKTPNGMPPMIGVMVKVDDCDATAKKVNALGGKAEAPFDVMQNGRMAVCKDPNGAAFDLWQAKSQVQGAVEETAHGAPSWFETRTSNVDRAGKFYHDLFGWTPEAMDIPGPGPKYSVYKLAGRQIGGMCGITKEMGEMSPEWVVFHSVDDADKAAAETTKLGGKVRMAPTDIPTVGRFALLTSPQGVPFQVIKYSQYSR